MSDGVNRAEAEAAATLLLAALRSDCARIDDLIKRIRNADAFAERARQLAELALEQEFDAKSEKPRNRI